MSILFERVGYKCDYCGKEHKGVDFPDGWLELNFEINSEYIDETEILACSLECYVSLILKHISGNEEITRLETYIGSEMLVALCKHIDSLNKKISNLQEYVDNPQKDGWDGYFNN